MKKWLVLLVLLLVSSVPLGALAQEFPYVTGTSDLIQVKVAQVPIPWQFWAVDPGSGNVIDSIRISPTWLNPPLGQPAGTGDIFVKRQYATTDELVPLEDLLWGDSPGPLGPVPGLQWATIDEDWVQVVVGQDLTVPIIPPSNGGAVLVAYEVKTDVVGGGAIARFINEAMVAPPNPLQPLPQIIQILVNFDIHNNTGYDDITNFELDFANLAFKPEDVIAALGFVKAHGNPPVPYNPPIIEWGANKNSPLVVRPINNGTGTEVKWIQTDRPLVTCEWLHVGLVFNGNWVNNGIATVQGYWTTIPVITSCDAAGNPKNQFLPGEDVYVKGSGLLGSPVVGTNYLIYIQPDPVVEGQALVAASDPSMAQELVNIGPAGTFGPTLIWAACAGPQTNWDIVVDQQNDGGNTGKFNQASDGIDDATVVGFVAPVPERSTIVLLSIGFLGLVGWFGMRSWRRRSSQAKG